MSVSQSDVLTGTAAGVHDQHDVQVFAVFLHGAAVALGGSTPEVVVQPDAVALVGFTPEVSYCPKRSLLDVSRRFGKRDGDSLRIASSRLENENAVSGCLETINQSDARFGTYGCFPMACEV